MPIRTAQPPRDGDVKQFSVFAENKVGRLNELTTALVHRDVHILALSMVETTDSAVIRIVVDYPEVAEEVLTERFFAHDTIPVLAVELQSPDDLSKITMALTQAEINIHYVYSFLTRPNGAFAIILRVEDNELANEVLRRSGMKVLGQRDLAR